MSHISLTILWKTLARSGTDLWALLYTSCEESGCAGGIDETSYMCDIYSTNFQITLLAD